MLDECADLPSPVRNAITSQGINRRRTPRLARTNRNLASFFTRAELIQFLSVPTVSSLLRLCPAQLRHATIALINPKTGKIHIDLASTSLDGAGKNRTTTNHATIASQPYFASNCRQFLSRCTGPASYIAVLEDFRFALRTEITQPERTSPDIRWRSHLLAGLHPSTTPTHVGSPSVQPPRRRSASLPPSCADWPLADLEKITPEVRPIPWSGHLNI